ncbi:MAG: isoprenyl transferase [Clostridiales bacterium]
MSIEKLLNEIDQENVPKHIAIIMDGNGRWAENRQLARFKGHVAGTKIIKNIIRKCSDLGVKVLTLYCFSTENWRRPLDEVNFLMDLIRSYLMKEAKDMVNEGVHLMHIGDLTAVPEKVQKEFACVEVMTKDCSKITLNIAVNYGSRQEILGAVKTVIQDVKDEKISVDDLDESTFSQYLETGGLPDPDLLIRTSGEQRISNYLLWQIAYSEIYFTDVNWPNFNEEELYLAILDYQKRHRRFGGI